MSRHDIVTFYLILPFVSVSYVFDEKNRSAKCKVELMNEERYYDHVACQVQNRFVKFSFNMLILHICSRKKKYIYTIH